MTVKKFRKILNKSTPSPFEPLCVLCSRNMRSRLLKQFSRHPIAGKINLILASSNCELNLRLSVYYQKFLEEYQPC